MAENDDIIVRGTQPIASYPVMNTGQATPYIALFNYAGIPIMNPYTGIPIGASITQFAFKYEIDESTECHLEFTVPGVDIVDIMDLQEGVAMYLQWGYIYPETRTLSSKPKQIQLKEVDYQFDDQGTHIKIKGLAVANDLKYLPVVVNPKTKDYITQGKKYMTDAMDEGFNRNIGIIIRKFKNQGQNG